MKTPFILLTCINLLLIMNFADSSAYSQEQKAIIKEYQQNFTTYPYSDPNPIPVVPKSNFYSTLTLIYPYFRYEGFTDKPVQKSWKVVELENEFIKVLILPEIGGKIWTAIEKSTNQPFIYYNHVVKFRDIGLRGPYTSGGLELNFGILGHTPNCATPVDYLTMQNDDGSVSCIVGVLDLLTRSSWRLEIRLPKDKAYFITKTTWHNSTPLSQPYYTWLNGGFKADGNLRFIYPGTSFIGHEGETGDWPLDKANGKDVSFYEQNDFGLYKSYHILGKYTDFFGGYWHDDDFGVAHYASHDDKPGKKIWIWGLSRQGMIWEDLLTDTDGQYVEMQSGRLFNQSSESSTLTPFKHMSFHPYSTDIWTEYWYPVLQTKGFVFANEFGAINIKKQDNLLKIYFCPVQNISDQLEITENGKRIYIKELRLTPLQTFTDSVIFTGDQDKLKVTLGGDKLVYYSDPDEGVLSRPITAPSGFDWNSVYGLYAQGEEYMDQKIFTLAAGKFQSALEKDPHYLPALVKMAELKYRNMLYAGALDFARMALSIDTHDGSANYYYGLINAKLGNIADAKDGFDVAALSSEYRSAAYTELCRLYFKEKSYQKALNYAERATDYNKFNIEALQLRALISRYRNDGDKSAMILDNILSIDPLNHFCRSEKYLSDPSENNKVHFTSLIRNEMPHETFMELALWYFNSGCASDAIKVLETSPKTPESVYWLSYLRKEKADLSGINLNFAFPFRSETAAVLENLLQSQDDWQLKYQLALIYRDRDRGDESIKLLTSCADLPDFAPFYAYRAEVFKERDKVQCENDLKKALTLDNKWRYHLLLANYYLSDGEYSKALSVTEAWYGTDKTNFNINTLHAKALLFNGKLKEADAVLAKINIIPFEGSMEGRDLYRETKLMLAVVQMQKKDYRSALKFIDAARLWPENLGNGKPYDYDTDTRMEDWMSYMCYLQLNKVSQGEEMLRRIISFQPRIENLTLNFYATNALVTLWAYEKLDRKDEGMKWLNEQILAFPNNKLLLLSRDLYQNSNIPVSANEKDGNVRILERLNLISNN